MPIYSKFKKAVLFKQQVNHNRALSIIRQGSIKSRGNPQLIHDIHNFTTADRNYLTFF